MSLGFKAALIVIALAILSTLWVADRSGQYDIGKLEGRQEAMEATLEAVRKRDVRRVLDHKAVEDLRNSLRKLADEHNREKQVQLQTDFTYKEWREQEVPQAAMRSIFGM